MLLTSGSHCSPRHRLHREPPLGHRAEKGDVEESSPGAGAQPCRMGPVAWQQPLVAGAKGLLHPLSSSPSPSPTWAPLILLLPTNTFAASSRGLPRQKCSTWHMLPSSDTMLWVSSRAQTQEEHKHKWDPLRSAGEEHVQSLMGRVSEDGPQTI